MSGAWRGWRDPAAVCDCRQSWCVCRAVTDCRGSGGHRPRSLPVQPSPRVLVIADRFRLLAGTRWPIRRGRAGVRTSCNDGCSLTRHARP
jgi:hypothetical protein